jgi:CDGSH-type Zn-finger protein
MSFAQICYHRSMVSVKILVGKNGPYRVEGDFAIVDPEGKEYGLGGRTSISLCRCGHSQNKPFCDGSHRQVEFQDDPHARDLPPPVPKPS